MLKWLDNTGKERDIVISSRIRLARNLENYKFPIKITEQESEEVIKEIVEAIEKSNSTLTKNYEFFRIKDIPEIEKNVLIEKHLISPDLVEKDATGGFVLSNNEKMSIMINEEDHIRLQILGSGLCLNECWDYGSKVDDILEKKLNYAFDEKVGYLTSCPTNIGTGMRASVMLHLPALALTNQAEKILLAVSQLGVAIRGVYGEGTKSMGNLYQISNQGTLGASEERIIDRINKITLQIVDKERLTRKKLLEKNKTALEDKVWRSYGILKNSRIISTEESMRLISNIKLGLELDIIEGINTNELDILITEIQPNNIQYTQREELTLDERDIKRAEIIRNKFKDSDTKDINNSSFPTH